MPVEQFVATTGVRRGHTGNPGKSAHRRVLAGPEGDQRPALQRRDHDRAQSSRVGRLDQMLVESGGQRAGARRRLIPAGQRGEVQGATMAAPEGACDPISADVGKPDIADHNLGMKPLDLRERGLTGHRGPALVAERGQQHARSIGGVGMVVDDEHTTARTTKTTSRLGQHTGEFNMERLRLPSTMRPDSMKVSSSAELP